MRHYCSLLLVAASFLGVFAGCSDAKKSVEVPKEQAPPAPAKNKTPAAAEK